MNEITTEELQDTIEAAFMGIWHIELFEGEVPRMKATPMMLELLGLNKDTCYSEEQIYDAWYSHICPEALQSVKDSVDRMISGQQDENTYLWEHPTKGKRYVRCGGIAHRVPGRGYSIVGYHYDVTDMVLQQKEQEEIVTALASTYACLYSLDLVNNTYITYNNTIPSVRKIIGDKGNLAEALDKFRKHLCHPESANVIAQFTDLSTINRRTRHTNCISAQFRGPNIECAEISLQIYERDSEGRATKAIWGVKDISDQKRHEIEQVQMIKQSVEASKSKTAMLQNMTHELRTPLNAMFGFSQLLSMPDGCVTEAEKTEYFNYIYNSFNMLTMHIDDVLDLADAEHGNYRVEIGDVLVNDTCHTAMQMAETRCPAGVLMHFKSDVDDSYTIKSDARRIQQVLINFLTNSCKHTMEGEILLAVSTTETPGHLTLSVTDTGEGIPANMQKEIFERYKKAEGNNAQGSGLGLNICSIIAEKLNAEIKLDTSYTNGARFLFIL